MTEELKLRWKIFAILLGILIGVSGALILRWYYKRKYGIDVFNYDLADLKLSQCKH